MIDFTAVQDTVETLKKRFEAGELTEETFEHELLNLIDQADDGYYWMIGHHTGQWYRFDGKRWLVDQPHTALEPYRQVVDADETEGELDIHAAFFSILILLGVGLIIYVNSTAI